MLGMIELSDNISTAVCLSYANTSVNVRDAATGMDGDAENGVHDGGVDSVTGRDGDTHEHMRDHVCHMQIQA